MSLVSIIVPCYNEEATIRLLLNAIYSQNFPSSDLEVIISDGLSTDRTRQEVTDFIQAHPDLSVCVVDNPKRSIPSGLNRAIDLAQGEYVVRLDAHSVPAPDYVARCIADLVEGKGDNVGGVWDIQPGGDGWLAQSIAIAASHPFGVGDARYRYTRKAGYVDTVPFGAFKRALLKKIGRFDESLQTNEDYEFNARLRQSGGKVWLNPAIRSVYFSRSNLRELALQYWRYGFWKWQMLRRYPSTLRWRQALPPAFVLGLAVGLALSPWWSLARFGLAIAAVSYILFLFIGAILGARRQRDIRLLAGVPLAIGVMHLCWGTGFLASLFQGIGRKLLNGSVDN